MSVTAAVIVAASVTIHSVVPTCVMHPCCQALLRNARAEGTTSSSPGAQVPGAVNGGVQCRSFSERITSWMQTPAHQTFTQALQQGMVLFVAISSVFDPWETSICMWSERARQLPNGLTLLKHIIYSNSPSAGVDRDALTETLCKVDAAEESQEVEKKKGDRRAAEQKPMSSLFIVPL